MSCPSEEAKFPRTAAALPASQGGREAPGVSAVPSSPHPHPPGRRPGPRSHLIRKCLCLGGAASGQRPAPASLPDGPGRGARTGEEPPAGRGGGEGGRLPGSAALPPEGDALPGWVGPAGSLLLPQPPLRTAGTPAALRGCGGGVGTTTPAFAISDLGVCDSGPEGWFPGRKSLPPVRSWHTRPAVPARESRAVSYFSGL